MRPPVCVKCSFEMRPVKIGMYVVETFLSPPEPYRISSADMYRCPECGCEVLTGYSTGAKVHHEEGFGELFQKATANLSNFVVVYERKE